MARIERLPLATLAASALLAVTASAQEPTYMDAATHPGAGRYYTRLLFAAGEIKAEGDDFDRQALVFKSAYGLRSDLAVLLDAELVRRETEDGSERGLSLASLRLKQRVLQRDLGPLNTWRASLLLGAALPGGNKAVAPEEPLPLAGIVSTAILGRHGLNAEIEWRGYRRAADVYELNAAHLYRLAPARYNRATRGAWYTMIESLNRVDTDGGHICDAAAGLLYENRRWAAEASFRTSLDADWERETKHELRLGLRLLF
jgi:hypothetical protein